MENNMKQTAVEWLLNQMDLETISKYDKQLLQAKAMHKNEIINAVEGFPIENRGLLGEDYYNKTYGGNK